MKISYKIVIFIIGVICCLQATFDYRYPLGHAYNRLFFLMQYNDKSSLCSTSNFKKITSNNTVNELSSLYNPYYVDMLPDAKGLCFVDADVLHIDYLHEREPRALELDEPLDNFGIIHWLNDCICYVTARQQQQTGVWLINSINGATQQVYLSAVKQALLFPSIIIDDHDSGQLFIFEQSTKKNGKNITYNQRLIALPVVCEQRIKKKVIFNLEELLSQTFEKKLPHRQTVRDLFCSPNSCGSLVGFSMHTVDFGHFVSFNGYKNDKANFSVYKIEQKNNLDWQQELLFSFVLPRLHVLGGSEEVNHFSTLLPRLLDDSLYFLNIDDCNHMKLHVYQLTTGEIEKIKTPNCFVEDCVPNYINGQLAYGGVITN